MLNLAGAFAEIAAAVGEAAGAPFWPGQVIDQTAPGHYNGDGDYVPGSAPARRDCRVQIDSADWSMRQASGFVEGMVRFIVLSAGLNSGLGTDASVEVLDGPHAGRWLVSSIVRDPAAIGYVGQGKPA